MPFLLNTDVTLRISQIILLSTIQYLVSRYRTPQVGVNDDHQHPFTPLLHFLQGTAFPSED
ncbi:CLUMA_CG021658, isoform A [Clunio marinus]|uniref:CLUMA_CG021658, isoform A n=1 Tax=Clunio marinus TaxID=568069 RepID=A0A1J1J8N5_9DIPT|nr:CLUMA_CG021658, isoform A [Clunio marinus]